MDDVDLFDIEMYMSGMHGEHDDGKTSSFKRCLFLKGVEEANVADRLMTIVESRSSPLCYLHLLQGGGAVGDVAVDATAFDCRDWDFVCVITEIWLRDQDDIEIAQSIVRWVYNVAGDLLSLSSSGIYGVDLEPNLRDAAMTIKAFEPNRPRLARLKHSLDSHNVLTYACPLSLPLSKASMKPKLLILVTGESCAGKDYCAEV